MHKLAAWSGAFKDAQARGRWWLRWLWTSGVMELAALVPTWTGHTELGAAITFTGMGLSAVSIWRCWHWLRVCRALVKSARDNLT